MLSKIVFGMYEIRRYLYVPASVAEGSIKSAVRISGPDSRQSFDYITCAHALDPGFHPSIVPHFVVMALR